MSTMSLRRIAAAALSFAAGSAWADAAPPMMLDPVQVTATREPEPVSQVPASISVVTGEDLRARGAYDLRTALSLVAGVEGTSSGDAGPAGSVPAMQGLREADAYLLVVDGVPWGGAFNPATPSIDMSDVARIEILRGAAPVMYGATSFNGVIQIIHYAPGEMPTTLSASGGQYGSYGIGFTGNLPAIGGYKQGVSVNLEKRGFAVDHEEFKRAHLLYRGAADLSLGHFHVDADVSILPQTPGSVLVGNPTDDGFRTDLPINANYNPADGKLNQKRVHLTTGLESSTPLGGWTTTLAVTRTTDDIVRGFLRKTAPDDTIGDAADADGFAQKRQITDVYADTHVLTKLGDAANLTWGLDYLYGKGKQTANNFAYFVNLDGSGAPDSGAQHVDEIASSNDKRNFYGAYAQLDWRVLTDVDVLAGLRFNRTLETTEGLETDNTGPTPVDTPHGPSNLSKNRVSGVLGASWHLISTTSTALTLYADARNTYKPLAVDFGPEAEVSTLQPETSTSFEIGAKGHLLDGSLSYDVSGFVLNFNNGLIFDSMGASANGGQQRFKGGELELQYALSSSLRLAANYSYHDSRFVRFVDDGGNDVSGNRLQASPYHLAGLGVIYLPQSGLFGSVIGNYAGARALDPENMLKAGGYTTLDAGLGYRFSSYTVHVTGSNLTDRRVPTSGSELSEVATGHDGLNTPGYYLLPARTVLARVSVEF